MPLVLAILFFFWSFGVFHLTVYQSPSYYHHGLPTQDKTLIQCDYRFFTSKKLCYDLCHYFNYLASCLPPG